MAQRSDNPNIQGPFGNTLLHSAVAGGDLGEVHRLLAAGADPRIANREGHTPLRVAVLLGHDDIYRALVAPLDDHVERMLDEALRETFPASDPIAVTPRRGR
jgi:ankyrin repeat protein